MREYKIKYAKIDTKSFVEKYVDVPLVLGYCKNCKNYGKVYSCPSFDFNVLDVWKSYKYLHLVAFIVLLTDEEKSKQFTKETFYDEIDRFYTIEKGKITDIQYKILEDNPNTKGLGGGRCQLCKVCKRESNEPCIYKDKLMMSIESLGGKVSEVTKDLLGIDIVWSKDFKYPEYITSVIGFLSNDENIKLDILERYMRE